MGFSDTRRSWPDGDQRARGLRELRFDYHRCGGYFCAGGILRNIATVGLDSAGWRNRLRLLHAWPQKLMPPDGPVIVAVDGAAFGGGFSLLLTTDFSLVIAQAGFP